MPDIGTGPALLDGMTLTETLRTRLATLTACYDSAETDELAAEFLPELLATREALATLGE